jgi:hypothetical protein
MTLERVSAVGTGVPVAECPVAAVPAPFTRRSLLRRGTGVAVGAAVMWSAPSIRTSAISSNAPGSPPPTPPVESQALTRGSADPVEGANTATLPLTGTDPRGLLIAGGTAMVAGSALLASVQDPEASRGEN